MTEPFQRRNSQLRDRWPVGPGEEEPQVTWEEKHVRAQLRSESGHFDFELFSPHAPLHLLLPHLEQSPGFHRGLGC